jgi:hypothetical protein
MAIANTTINLTDTLILTVPADKSYAITTILVCNTAVDDGTGLSDTGFDMHVIPNGQTKTDTNLVINNVRVAAEDTFTFNVERIVLEQGDSVVFVGRTPTNLSATISYLEV